jgi:hypothetical protein
MKTCTPLRLFPSFLALCFSCSVLIAQAQTVDVAAADAEAKLTKHITTGPKIKIDGVEEEHQIVKSKDPAAIKNLVQYILSR